MYQRPYRPRPPQSCAGCGFLPVCGGLDGEAYASGCFKRCVDVCQFSGCDMACPCLHLNFPDLVEEAGGLWVPPKQSLLPVPQVGALPLYIPQINHGSSRDILLEEPIVVVPLSTVVGRSRGGKYDVRFSSPEALRERLKLRHDCEIIVSSVAPDQIIEDFWESHVSRAILPKLAMLRLRGMTVPNFSFMLDVPRINSIYNLSRMFRVAERMSDAGLPTILHIQASTRRDWSGWAEVLREQSRCSIIAAEFQTGPSRKPIGDPYFAGLAELQQGAGRPLHLLAIAGAGRLRQMRTAFASSTIVDSTPFLRTVHRQKLIQIGARKWKWRPNHTDAGEKLSSLLQWNVKAQTQRFTEIVTLGQTDPQQPPSTREPPKHRIADSRMMRFDHSPRTLSSPSSHPPVASARASFR